MENGGRGEGPGRDVRQQASDLAHGMQEQLEDLRGYADEASGFIREFARERPVAAVAIAAGIGFVLGRVLARK
jgi:ElaB/YqjD/DUF883 family membrane-anchored ribosome-binding protein